jgi:hypothetical protein
MERRASKVDLNGKFDRPCGALGMQALSLGIQKRQINDLRASRSAQVT